MKPLSRVIAAFSAIALAVAVGADDAGADAAAVTPRSTFERTCSQCHPLSKVTAEPRPAAEWPALVKRMQTHAQTGDKTFDNTVADEITAFLVHNAAAADPSLNPAPAEAASEAGEMGEALGIATAVLIAAMIVAGALRRRIGRRFRLLHRSGAVLLVCALAAHAAILFLSYGPPNSLWHLCGSGAFLLVGVTALLGLNRRRIGRRFVPVHASAAGLTAALALLHRLLA